MKKIFLILIAMFSLKAFAQNPPNWTEKQLMEPSALAASINSGKDVPVILCVGPGAVIPNSIQIGMTRDEANKQKLKQQLEGYKKNTKIVIYCGCCPFDHCPNVRPAIDILKEMKFTNYYLLDLPHNVKTDWINPGYPVTQ